MEIVLEHAGKEMAEEDPDGGDPRADDRAIALDKGQRDVQLQDILPELEVIRQIRTNGRGRKSWDHAKEEYETPYSRCIRSTCSLLGTSLIVLSLLDRVS